jgi:hypothetical protein
MPNRSNEFSPSRRWIWAREFASTEKPAEARSKKNKREKAEMSAEILRKYPFSYWSKTTLPIKISAMRSSHKTQWKPYVPSKSLKWSSTSTPFTSSTIPPNPFSSTSRFASSSATAISPKGRSNSKKALGSWAFQLFWPTNCTMTKKSRD